MSDNKLCYQCMEPLDDGVHICPNCGYDNNSVTLANYLKPGTILHERYLIGLMQNANGEGVTYIAFDQHIKCKVLVREYFPEQLCSRVQGSTEIDVDSNHLAQYKALMAEYTELNKALARLRHLSHLNPALDLFAENNTTYAVYEYFEGGTLLNYLKENAGELSWNTVKRIFPPLFTSLSMLHNAGVLHRGLSPETIFVTDRGELKLRGFCISAVRTQDTELDAELFDGYAAPEQYFADRSQGTWTDVYGICAVLYRILTGARATDAISRGDYDNLIPPADVNPQVPDTVSQAIMRGLKLDASARVRTVTDLVTLLFESPAEAEEPRSHGNAPASGEQRPGSTAVFPAQSGQRSAGGTRSGQRPQTAGTRSAAGSRSAGGNGYRPSGGSAPRTAAGNGTRTRTAGSERAVGYAGQRSRAVADEPSLFERIKVPMFIAVLFLAIVALIIVVFMQIWENSGASGGGKNSITWQSQPGNVAEVPKESTQAPNYNAIMPGLVGMDFKLKREDLAADGFLSLEPTYEFSDEYSKDVIMWQEIEEGQPIVMGSTVKVRVSRGSCNVAVPDFSGLKLNEYLAKLEEAGFAKAIEYYEAPAQVTTAKNNNKKNTTTTTTTTTIPANVQTNEAGAPQIVYYKEKVDYRSNSGYVCAVEPEVGSIINVKQGYTITVYYANNTSQPKYTTVTSTTKKGQTTTTTKTTAVTKNTVATSSTTKQSVTTSVSSSTTPATTPSTTPSTTPPTTTSTTATTPAPPPQTSKATTAKPVENPPAEEPKKPEE